MADLRMLSSVYSASKKNQLCITQTLSNVESVTGPLTLSKILQIVPSIATGQTSSLDGVNLCTPCVKQIYNVAKTDFPTIFGAGDVASNVQAKCGASFVGKLPLRTSWSEIDFDRPNYLFPHDQQMAHLIPISSKLPTTGPALQYITPALMALSRLLGSRPSCRPSCWLSWLWLPRFPKIDTVGLADL